MAAARKILVVLAVLCVVMAAMADHGTQPTHKPNYKYEYAVHDGKSADVKQQSEHRDGHRTDSQYSLLEADLKNTRKVKLTVDSTHH